MVLPEHCPLESAHFTMASWRLLNPHAYLQDGRWLSLSSEEFYVTDTMSTKWSWPGPAAVPRGGTENLFLQERQSQLWEESDTQGIRTQTGLCSGPAGAQPGPHPKQTQTFLWGLHHFPTWSLNQAFLSPLRSAGQLPAPGARRTVAGEGSGHATPAWLAEPGFLGPLASVSSQPKDGSNVLITVPLGESALSRTGLMWTWAGAQSVPG